ncbi:MAG: hypothetical protein SCL54_17680, partial [Bacillota bacterium]|nr:hypothetical protein [Bacillota bacterium]
MGDDYDEFIETGEYTEKQNIAHANAELIREVRPYIFEKIDHCESTSDWEFEGKDVHPDRIVYTYTSTKTITDVYQND